MALQMIFSKELLWAFVFCALPTCSTLSAAGHLPVQHSTTAGVCFNGFVNWNYSHRQNLKAWKNTAFAIKRTLEIWAPQHLEFAIMENGSPQAFQQFLNTLPNERICDVNLVYLASHQSPAGEWDFPENRLLSLNTIIGGANIPVNPRRIVILDTCFAAAANNHPLWRQQLAPVSLFASAASEETPEANFHSPQPVDFAHRYPAVYAWLKDCLGKEWDGKISFLGFVWVQTFLANNHPPRDMAGWIDFADRCQVTASEFRERVSKKSSSEITVTK